MQHVIWNFRGMRICSLTFFLAPLLTDLVTNTRGNRNDVDNAPEQFFFFTLKYPYPSDFLSMPNHYILVDLLDIFPCHLWSFEVEISIRMNHLCGLEQYLDRGQADAVVNLLQNVLLFFPKHLQWEEYLHFLYISYKIHLFGLLLCMWSFLNWCLLACISCAVLNHMQLAFEVKWDKSEVWIQNCFLNPFEMVVTCNEYARQSCAFL